MRGMEAESFDALVTDPPAGISFMGRSWDSNRGGREKWIAWLSEIMAEAMRTVKPGAHGLVWALPRASHWTGMALELAGFEVRDRITHHFGTGFPKSKNQLKPATEDWWLVRKPGSPETGKGTGLNIEECRIPTDEDLPERKAGYNDSNVYGTGAGFRYKPSEYGRYPANLILGHSESCNGECDESCPVRVLDGQSGHSSAKHSGVTKYEYPRRALNCYSDDQRIEATFGYGDEGGASRFFYVAKPSRAERNAGLEGMPRVAKAQLAGANKNDNLDDVSGRFRSEMANHHPTVKSVTLMRYLVRLITPNGGTILDPFGGSGTTGVAALLEGFRPTLIEAEEDYVEIARARLEHVKYPSGEQVIPA